MRTYCRMCDKKDTCINQYSNRQTFCNEFTPHCPQCGAKLGLAAKFLISPTVQLRDYYCGGCKNVRLLIRIFGEVETIPVGKPTSTIF